MAQWTAFTGYYDPSNGNQWAFFPTVSNVGSTLDAANSSTTLLVFNHSDGTKTRISGTGLSANIGGISWTSLTSVAHFTALEDLIQRIDNLGAVGSTPGSGVGASAFGTFLVSGNDALSGSGGRDIMTSGEGSNTYESSPGGDFFFGGAGDDLIRIVAASHLNDSSIGGGAGTDRFQLEFNGTLNFLPGQTTFLSYTLAGIEIVKFAQTGELRIITSSEHLRPGSPAAFEGGPGRDILEIVGQNFQPLTFTNWTSGQDRVFISGGSNNGPITGTHVDDTITLLGTVVGGSVTGNGGHDIIFGGVLGDTLEGNDGDDTLTGGAGADALDGGAGRDVLDGGVLNDTMKGGAGNDTYKVDHVGDIVDESISRVGWYRSGSVLDQLQSHADGLIHEPGEGDGRASHSDRHRDQRDRQWGREHHHRERGQQHAARNGRL